MNLRALSLDRTPPADYDPAEPIGADRSLTAWADYYGSDKGSLKHGYTAIYEPLLAQWRDKPIYILEIGVACGASLKMWSRYFPHASVYGVDIRPECAFICEGYPNITIWTADAAKIAPAGVNFDLIVDDGSHIAGHIAKAFALHWPLLNPGGLYIVEDLRCTHNPNYSVPFPVDEADKDRRHLMHLIDHMLRVMDNGGECESISFHRELMILRKR